MFEPEKAILTKDGRLTPLGDEASPFSWTAPRNIIISRGLCAFNRIRLNPDLSAAKRRQAAELQARVASPFEHPALYLVISGDYASAWTWDQAAFEAKTQQPARLGVPETVFCPVREGFALQCCLNGFEGQYWADGHIRHSRWWSQAPSAGEWRLFQASVTEADPSAASLPEALDAPDWQSEAIKQRNAMALSSRLKELSFPMMGAIAALILLPIFGFMIASALTLSLSNNSLQKRVETLQVDLGDKRAAAMAFSRAQARLRQYDLTTQQAPLLLPVSVILEKVTQVDSTIRAIRFFDGKIELTFVTQDTVDTVEWVRQLESSPSLRGVEIGSTVRPGEWVISGEVDRGSLLAAQMNTGGVE